METLDEHNEKRWKAHTALMDEQKSHPNGIECPKCGKELWDSNPMITLTSNPPQKDVHCPACGYVGYRLA